MMIPFLIQDINLSDLNLKAELHVVKFLWLFSKSMNKPEKIVREPTNTNRPKICTTFKYEPKCIVEGAPRSLHKEIQYSKLQTYAVSALIAAFSNLNHS